VCKNYYYLMPNAKLTDECHESRQLAQKLFCNPQTTHNPKSCLWHSYKSSDWL